MAPETEAAQAQRQAAAQGRRHTDIGGGSIAAPVQRVALAAGPRAACPDDVLAADLAGYAGHGLVVAQRVQVVLVETGAPVGVHAVERRGFPEIGLDRAHAHLEQAAEVPLVPFHGRGIREVQHRIFEGQVALAVLYVETLLDDLGEQPVLRNEIGQLPERDVDALLFQVGDHLGRVLEAGGGELVVAAPVVLEPAGVDVDHVGGEALRAQPGSHAPHLVLREVGDTAHPQAEAPQRRHGGLSGEVGVLVEDLLRLAEEDEQVQLVVAQLQRGGALVGRAEVEGGRSGSVDEHAIAAVAQEERDGFVHARALGALRVIDVEHDLLPALVQLGKRLAAAEELLSRREREHGRQASRVVRGPANEGEGQHRHLRPAVIRLMIGAREQAAFRVAKLDVPGLFVNAYGAGHTGVAVAAVDLRHLPGTVGGRLAHQHQLFGRRLGLEGGAYPDAYGPRRDELDREGKGGVDGVLDLGERHAVEGLERAFHGVERHARVEVVALPVERAGSGGGIEIGQAVGQEVGVGEVVKVAADIDGVAQHGLRLVGGGGGKTRGGKKQNGERAKHKESPVGDDSRGRRPSRRW